MENACRHFKGLYPDDRPACARGWDVRAWAVRCNGGSNHGIALRLPCTKQSEDAEAPLFDCPSLDRKTDDQIEAERKAISEHMDRFISAMPKLSKMKERMIKGQNATAKATCPWCDAKGQLRVSVALSVNNHMRAKCLSCDMGFIE